MAIIKAMEQQLIDCHAHLIYENQNATEIIDGMQNNNLAAIVCVATSPTDIDQVLNIAQNNQNVYAALAYYPEYAQDITEEDYQKLERLAQHKKVVAIGECGLDYHTTDHFKAQQKECLERQIEIAKKLQKPLMIHIRGGEDDLVEILKAKANGLKDIIIHCYSALSKELTQQFVSMGAYISFAGNFTYKKFRREDISLVPLDHLLVETDSPYLSPAPLRGTVNQPKNVHITASVMAQELDMNQNQLKKILLENAKRVFGI